MRTEDVDIDTSNIKDEVGTYPVIIKYNTENLTYTFNVEVINHPYDIVSINIEGAKTQFLLGQEFTLGNASIYKNFGNGTRNTLSLNEITIDYSNYDNNNEGNYTIYIKLNGTELQCSYEVSVVDIAPVAIEILNPKNEFYIGESFEIGELECYLIYSNGERALTTEYIIDSSNFNSSIVQTCRIFVYYSGDRSIYTTYNVRIFSNTEIQKVLDSLEVTGYKSLYYVGDSFDTTMSVIAYYSNGESQLLNADEYEIDSSNFDSSKQDSYNIVVSYQDKFQNFQVNVIEKDIEDTYLKVGDIAINFGNDYHNGDFTVSGNKLICNIDKSNIVGSIFEENYYFQFTQFDAGTTIYYNDQQINLMQILTASVETNIFQFSVNRINSVRLYEVRIQDNYPSVTFSIPSNLTSVNVSNMIYPYELNDASFLNLIQNQFEYVYIFDANQNNIPFYAESNNDSLILWILIENYNPNLSQTYTIKQDYKINELYTLDIFADYLNYPNENGGYNYADNFISNAQNVTYSDGIIGQGMYFNGNAYLQDTGLTSEIYNSMLLSSYKGNYDSPQGLTTDGEYFYVASSNDSSGRGGSVHKVDMATQNLVQTYNYIGPMHSAEIDYAEDKV